MLRRIPKALRLTNFHVASFSKTFKVQNPYTLDVYCESEYKTEPEMQKIVKESYECHKKWKNVPLNERIAVVKKAAEYFSKNEEAIAIDITGQMGKPIYQSREELQGFQNIVQSLVELAPEGLADKVVKENQQGLLKYTREPIGVSAVFSPWNFPVRTCASVLLTSVLAGNSVVIKHSPFTPLIAKHFEESFKYAGIDNLVRDLMIATEDSVKLYQMPEIGFVGFTGSSEVGRCVQDEITQNRFMDYTLELGGNNAAYVAEDADLDHSAKELIYGAMYNAGQSSNSISRIYVHSSLYQDFINMALKYVYSYQIGDPMKEETSLGPLCQSDKLEGIQRLVEEAAAQGARIVIGGMQAADSEGRGQFFEPTLIADAQNDMQLMMVETFGPLVGIGTTEDDEEVIKLINDNQFGLSAAIFSKDKERILRMAPRLNVGTVYGNKVMQVDPRLPWCGRKNSGLGTNLSLLGFHSVTKPKSYNLKFQV